MKALHLTALVSGEKRDWTLTSGPALVGRASANAVQLLDASVSREHAEFTVQGDRWFVCDLRSRNGTRVNGVPADRPVALAPGDIVEVGHVELRVAGDDAPVTMLLNAESSASATRRRVKDVLADGPSRSGDSSRLTRVLAEAGRFLVLPKPPGETCEEILRLVERAVSANRYIIMLRESEDAELQLVASRLGRGASASQALALSQTIIRVVLDENTAVVTSDAMNDARFSQAQSIMGQFIHSAMAAPLFDNDRVLGILYADSTNPAVTYSEDDLDLLTLLANMAAVKISNARMLVLEQERRRRAQEADTAARIQQGLLPVAPPVVKGYEFEAYLETCYEVGGDLYDFHVRSDGRVVFLVGDVSGKGMGASLLMSSFLSSARVLYESCDDLAVFARRLNEVTFRSSDASRFVTAFIGCLDPATGSVEYVNGGHNAPLLVHGATMREIEATGVPFGVLAEAPFAVGRFELAPGACVAVFSDGIPEAQRGVEFFDDWRLKELLLANAAMPVLAVREALVQAVADFVGDSPRSDDITLVLLKRDG